MIQELFGDFLPKVGIGFLLGFFLGYFLKKIAKLIVAFIGFLIALLIILEFYGVITINYNRLVELMLGIDIPNASFIEQFKEFLWNRLPFASSFFLGTYFGFKKG
ncbi:MAG: hypothetical protein DRJ39_02030 [Thermoprotei archaeon]|nr:MAG: hypothetical protein DRJ39_02030 [Thermoprotei archaeon]